MALKATIFKCELNISDLRRHYYQSHTLTVAQHPSENDPRMMLRILMFALYADQQLSFTKGLCSDDEPDLWLKSYSDEIELWIDLGQPDEKRVRKAAAKARQLVIATYGDGTAQVWWQQNQSKFDRFDNLTVLNISDEQYQGLGQFAERNMDLQITIEDDLIWFSNQQDSIGIKLDVWR